MIELSFCPYWTILRFNFKFQKAVESFDDVEVNDRNNKNEEHGSDCGQ